MPETTPTDFMPPLIAELVKDGHEVTLTTEGYKLTGFYKHGSVTLKHHELPDGGWYVEGRYGRLGMVADMADLAHLNFITWLDYRDRFDGWNEPEALWFPRMVEMKFVKVEMKRVVTPA